MTMTTGLYGLPGENQQFPPGTLPYPEYDVAREQPNGLVGYWKSYQQTSSGRLDIHPSIIGTNTVFGGLPVVQSISTIKNLVGTSAGDFITGAAAGTVYGAAGPNVPALGFYGNYYLSSLVPATGANPRALMAFVNIHNYAGGSYNHIHHYGTASTDQAWGITSVTGGNNNYGNHWWTNSITQWHREYSYGKFCVIINTYDGTKEYLYINGFQGNSVTKALNTGSTQGLTLFSRINSPAEQAGGFWLTSAAWNRHLSEQDCQEISFGLLNFMRQYGVVC